MSDKRISFNIRSSKTHGWDPSWFGSNTFDSNLISKIIEFQKNFGLTPDGMIGPETFRVLLTSRNAEREQYILCGGVKVPIKWPKVITFDEPASLKSNSRSFVKSPGRKPTMFVVHWDACLNSASCARVLGERNLSVHFCIDNDGTIYQLVDCENIAQHAAGVNSRSIGVEVSNAFYPKFQDWYVKNGFGERQVLRNTNVHSGKIDSHLDFYQVQKDALSVLIKTVCDRYSIPLQTPDSITEVPEVASGTYKGVVSHYHVTKSKIDCAGLDIKKLLE